MYIHLHIPMSFPELPIIEEEIGNDLRDALAHVFVWILAHSNKRTELPVHGTQRADSVVVPAEWRSIHCQIGYLVDY
jgi:hypothetical protein